MYTINSQLNIASIYLNLRRCMQTRCTKQISFFYSIQTIIEEGILNETVYQ